MVNVSKSVGEKPGKPSRRSRDKEKRPESFWQESFQPQFSKDFQANFKELLKWRRDVRRFRRKAVSEETLDDLLEAANLAPSVGLSQPWRFVIVRDEARRKAVVENFRHCNKAALQDYCGETAEHYAKLKLAGLQEAALHLAVYCDDATEQGHRLGRKTMPETLQFSVVASIQNLWLAARSLGVGVGWVSILDPQRIDAILDIPAEWRLIAYLCIGYPEEERLDPELERQKWEKRRPVKTLKIER